MDPDARGIFARIASGSTVGVVVQSLNLASGRLPSAVSKKPLPRLSATKPVMVTPELSADRDSAETVADEDLNQLASGNSAASEPEKL